MYDILTICKYKFWYYKLEKKDKEQILHKKIHNDN